MSDDGTPSRNITAIDCGRDGMFYAEGHIDADDVVSMVGDYLSFQHCQAVPTGPVQRQPAHVVPE